MEITFEQLPKAVTQLFDKLENIERLLLAKAEQQIQNPDELFTVEEAAKFLSLSVPTIYGLTSKKELPFMKRSKRIYFLKADLVSYLKAGRNKSNEELESIANDYLAKGKKK
jgi:excisionase family DNA binding protein